MHTLPCAPACTGIPRSAFLSFRHVNWFMSLLTLGPFSSSYTSLPVPHPPDMVKLCRLPYWWHSRERRYVHASQSGGQRPTWGHPPPPGHFAPISVWLCWCIQGVNKGKGAEGAEPRVTLLYTLLNLTGVDATLGWRATLESELV